MITINDLTSWLEGHEHPPAARIVGSRTPHVGYLTLTGGGGGGRPRVRDSHRAGGNQYRAVVERDLGHDRPRLEIRMPNGRYSPAAEVVPGSSVPMADGYLHCEACGHVFLNGDAGPPVYECGTCGQPQAGEEDARRCQLCQKFAAKVADRSCPSCEAPDEELAPATVADLAQHKQDQKEAEENRGKPRVESDWEKNWKAQREAEKAEYAAWWEKTGRAAFAGLADGDGHDLAAAIEQFIVESGSLSITFDRAAIRAVGDRLAGS